MKWRNPLRVLCDSNIYINLERKFYKKSTKHALFNDTGCWAVKKQHVYEMNVIEIKNINMEKRKKKKKEEEDRISNEESHLKITVASY